MFELLGDKKHRQKLDRLFKNPKSNFQIAIVVDMWITGFDVPCLAVLYNDKPLKASYVNSGDIESKQKVSGQRVWAGCRLPWYSQQYEKGVKNIRRW